MEGALFGKGLHHFLAEDGHILPSGPDDLLRVGVYAAKDLNASQDGPVIVYHRGYAPDGKPRPSGLYAGDGDPCLLDFDHRVAETAQVVPELFGLPHPEEGEARGAVVVDL